MPLPKEPVTLTAAQIEELSQKLSSFRHDVNNNLSLMVAAMEMIQRRPETASRMWPTLIEQPKKIANTVKEISAALEIALGITRP
ncbi:MAG TPA: hypothetical protein VFV23_05940 [Verrucomicrobiae bacterium]|nr:hypothetical protein [Verrucomicrobiae bacterium]